MCIFIHKNEVSFEKHKRDNNNSILYSYKQDVFSLEDKLKKKLSILLFFLEFPRKNLFLLDELLVFFLSSLNFLEIFSSIRQMSKELPFWIMGIHCITYL